MGHHGSEDDALLVLLQQRLEARVVAQGVPRWIQAEPGGGEFATPSLLVDGVRRW